MVNEKSRHTRLIKLIEKNPDWDWDYWVEQTK